MSYRKSNFPPAQQLQTEPGEVSQMVQRMEELRRLPKPESDADIESRVHWFFEWCTANDVRPSVELLSLSLGRTRQAVWKMQQAGGRKGEIITLAKQGIAALTEQWAITGKLNPAAYCFIMKNNYGYSDNVTLEVSKEQGEPRRRSIEQIQREYFPDGVTAGMLSELPDADFSEE